MARRPSKKTTSKGSRSSRGSRKTATKKKTAKSAAKSAKKRSTRKSAAARPRSYRARVRMYRQGLGDCFLITLPKAGPGDYHILIDCGVLMGPKEVLQGVVDDIAKATRPRSNATKGRIDLLVVTHEHMDHVSGFWQAEEQFKKIEIVETWMGWTEDPRDPQAQRLDKARHAMVEALATAQLRLQAMHRLGADGAAKRHADEIGDMLSFFGMDADVKGLGDPVTDPDFIDAPAAGSIFSARRTTRGCLNKARNLSDNVRYCEPGGDPVQPDGVDAKLYVLGPPRDEKLLKKANPSKRTPETYEMGAFEFFLDDFRLALQAGDDASPFATQFRIPIEAARGLSFFDRNYFSGAGDDHLPDQHWRKIDSDWLHYAADFAMKLDSATNNTSLVLAIELDDGDVLLFAGDAQVGNWLSWQDVTFTDKNGDVTSGPDLLHSTVLYKVGHHGSHNATLKEKGLEQMMRLRFAMIPVSVDMARSRKWDHMPLPKIVTRLEEKCAENDGAVVQLDEDAPSSAHKDIFTEALFHEIFL